ncbi:MAG TPA: 3-oxoacyl-ACP synthase [Nevskiales bacterium]|nr:3-oxoacyl-ACP synthase [Nevskiales bacterium]
MTACIAGLGVYLPAGRMSAGAIAAASGLPEAVVRDKLGITQKTVPSPDDHTNVMGVRAAQAALADAGIGAGAIDVVISINEEHKDYPVWTSGIKLAHDLGAHNAYAFDIGQKCGTGVLGLKLAKDLITADASVNAVLVAGGYRNGDLVDFKDPNTRFLYNLAAGGGAAVVCRGGHGHAILASRFITDGSFSEDVLVPVGGTRAPLTPDNVADYRLRVRDPAGMKARLEEKSLANFCRVVEDAVRESGATLADVKYIAMLHMKRSAHEKILERLGLAAGRSIYLDDYGHIGQVDQFLSLILARKAGKLNSGDLVVLVAAGIGYVWNALCLRWGGP